MNKDFPISLQKFSGRPRLELEAISREQDPEMLSEQLLVFAGRLEQAGKLEQAAEVYSALVDLGAKAPRYEQSVGRGFSPAPAAGGMVFRLAQQRLDALLGGGTFGLRAERLLDRFTIAATDYKMILPMMGASLAYPLARVWGMGRIGALSVESSAFLLGQRGLRALSGEKLSWEESQLGREWLATTFTLSALKLGGANLAKFEKSAPWLRQGAVLGGLWAGHHLEVALGLRAPVSESTALLDIVGAWASLSVGQNLGQRLMPRGWRELQQEVSVKDLEGKARPKIFLPNLVEGTAGPGAVRLSSFPQNGLEPQRLQPIQMSSTGPGGGGGRKTPPPEGVDPQLITRTLTSARWALVEKAHQTNIFGANAPRSRILTADLSFDIQTGRVLTRQEMLEAKAGSYFAIRVRADFVNNRIYLPEHAMKGYREMLAISHFTPAQKQVIEAILSLHDQEIGDVQRLANLPAAKGSRPSGPVVAQTVPTKKERSDPTLPLFGLDAKVVPKVITPVSVLKGMLTQLVRTARDETKYQDHPPLLYYLNPPVLLGRLYFNSQGQITASNFWRPLFSGDGKSVGTAGGPSDKEVWILVTQEGSLLQFQMKDPQDPKLFEILKGVVDLPETVSVREWMDREFPYLHSMLRQTGMGRLLLEFNDGLATGNQNGGKFIQRLYLIPESGEYRWIAQPQLAGKGIPNTTVAIIDSGVRIQSGFFGGRKPPVFKYQVRWGSLPADVQQQLEYVREKIQRAGANVYRP